MRGLRSYVLLFMTPELGSGRLTADFIISCCNPLPATSQVFPTFSFIYYASAQIGLQTFHSVYRNIALVTIRTVKMQSSGCATGRAPKVPKTDA